MPCAITRPETTTERPAGVTFGAAPLLDRLMDAGGREILDTIAKRSRRNIETLGRNLPNRRGGKRHGVLRGLRDEGLIQIRNEDRASVDSGHEVYTLTEAGWELVGGKPLWV